MKISKPLKETGWTEDEIHKRLDSIIEEDNIDCDRDGRYRRNNRGIKKAP